MKSDPCPSCDMRDACESGVSACPHAEPVMTAICYVRGLAYDPVIEYQSESDLAAFSAANPEWYIMPDEDPRHYWRAGVRHFEPSV